MIGSSKACPASCLTATSQVLRSCIPVLSTSAPSSRWNQGVHRCSKCLQITWAVHIRHICALVRLSPLAPSWYFSADLPNKSTSLGATRILFHYRSWLWIYFDEIPLRLWWPPSAELFGSHWPHIFDRQVLFGLTRTARLHLTLKTCPCTDHKKTCIYIYIRIYIYIYCIFWHINLVFHCAWLTVSQYLVPDGQWWKMQRWWANLPSRVQGSIQWNSDGTGLYIPRHSFYEFIFRQSKSS